MHIRYIDSIVLTCVGSFILISPLLYFFVTTTNSFSFISNQRICAIGFFVTYRNFKFYYGRMYNMIQFSHIFSHVLLEIKTSLWASFESLFSIAQTLPYYKLYLHMWSYIEYNDNTWCIRIYLFMWVCACWHKSSHSYLAEHKENVGGVFPVSS